jgi:hypothetical protein
MRHCVMAAVNWREEISDFFQTALMIYSVINGIIIVFV